MPGYTPWLSRVSPEFTWHWPHLAYIRKHLADVSRGACLKLAISTPPQHGKTEGLTVRYPAWRLHRDPGLRVGVGAYNQTHANRFSRKTRKIVRSLIPLSVDRKSANEWETQDGGSYVAVGVGSGITGMPIDLMLIDDPVKNREEADSVAHQERVWEWYMDDITTRLQEHAPAIVVMTRWNENDLLGRILASEDGPNWRYIRLPAIAEDDPDYPDPLGRKPGEPLCPERFTLEALEAKRLVMGEGFTGLYQCRPTPRGGLFFRREWFSTVDHVPEGPSVQRVRYWDLAASVKNSACYTAGVLLARNENHFYVEDVIRGRWPPAERNEVILQTAQLDVKRQGFRRTWVEEQPGAAGIETGQALVRKLAGYSCGLDRVTGDKVTRAEPVADMARQGMVKVVAANWSSAFLTELASFPKGQFKDQVDSLSGSFNKLARGPLSIVVQSY